MEEPVEDILRFYNFIQVFGDTLSNQGYLLDGSPDNTITIDGVNYLLQEDQETPIDFELPQDSTEYEVYQIQPSSIGYDNLTKEKQNALIEFLKSLD